MDKLWDKGFDEDARIDSFTVGNDRELDLLLAPYDILGTIAHIKMLAKVGLLPGEDLAKLLPELRNMYSAAVEGRFVIEPDVEDVHSQVELNLTRKLGDMGKKVHTGRSRNDQVLVDLKLFTRAEIEKTACKVKSLFETLQDASERFKDVLMPGYTHLQVAMPSSFGLWFGAYAESLTDDMVMLKAAWDIADRNPLGSAAGYGSSAPLDRTMTTKLLGFADLDWNSVYSQMTRGRMERAVAGAYSSVAETIGKLAYDCCLYSSQNFGFIKLPDALTTGSSIMPHKKNPDVFELVRAHCNKIIAVPVEIRSVTGNLPSGYFRDFQLLKEIYFPIFKELDDCLDIVEYAIKGMVINKNIMSDPRYKLCFSVEEVNHLVSRGVPFRDAYRQVAASIQDGTFEFVSASAGATVTASDLHHMHEGSLGNLCNDKIKSRMAALFSLFPFGYVHSCLESLLTG
ncbi:MAG: argininosuccinate lyase [Candidatus Cryptobacteroides sp.]|nr:argininosuccinate lyase [Candidatus Cryptobacteroides sp.]MEE3430041.1 argininosuccinate lyase [Candidatus Cryptobacteroides sp.]